MSLPGCDRPSVGGSSCRMIVASDPHSPDGVRANGTPTNVDAFAKAFGCKEGDAMVNSGDKKVVIW